MMLIIRLKWSLMDVSWGHAWWLLEFSLYRTCARWLLEFSLYIIRIFPLQNLITCTCKEKLSSIIVSVPI